MYDKLVAGHVDYCYPLKEEKEMADRWTTILQTLSVDLCVRSRYHSQCHQLFRLLRNFVSVSYVLDNFCGNVIIYWTRAQALRTYYVHRYVKDSRFVVPFAVVNTPRDAHVMRM